MVGKKQPQHGEASALEEYNVDGSVVVITLSSCYFIESIPVGERE